MGNRQRPHHGGTHARRIHGTSTCHHAPPQRPTCRVHLSGPGPLPVLVPQVVAPLPRVGRRGPVRPDPRHPPRRPTHRAELERAILSIRRRLQAHASPTTRYRLIGARHLGRTQGPRHPPASQPAHHRAHAPAQRLDRAAGPSRPAASTPGVPRPQARASNELHEVDLVGPVYLKGSGHRYYIWVGKDAFDGAVCLRLAYSRRMDEILWFLGECWKDLGRPEQVQLDNARELAGWGPSAHTCRG